MDTNKPAIPKDPEVIRKKVLSDPNTAKIAENLGVPLEEYVNQVIHFVLNPNAEPSLYVVEDEDLRAMGYPPPDADAMGQYIIEAATIAQTANPSRTEFTEARKPPPVQLETPTAAAKPEQEDSALKAELEKARRAGHGRQG
jgi:hypothetical protein